MAHPDVSKTEDHSAFIDSFAAKLEAAESGASDEAEHEASDGSPPADETTEHDSEDGQSDEDGADEATEDSDEDEEAASTEAADEADDEDVEDKEEEEAAEEDEPADDAVDVTQLLKDAGLKTTLKDLPKEIQPLARKKLDEMQGAFTRAMQQQTEWRKERAELLAEQRFREQNPALAIVELLNAHPEVSDEINTHIDKNLDPDKLRSFGRDVEDARKKAAEEVLAAQAEAERLLQRGDEIEAYVRSAAKKLGFPDAAMNDIEEGIAYLIGQKPIGQRDISEEEVDRVLRRKLAIYRGTQRRNATATAQASIQARATDRRTSTPAVRAGSGVVPPAPSGKTMPKNDKEFAAMFVRKL
jgi:hypothetical protein